ncbi:MAG: flagellar protein FliS [Provencibacterium sp.]|jgi:flagellar biosynthetic protein FliS|nr:flagellar protein FliS [Provencibacterium sp.]
MDSQNIKENAFASMTSSEWIFQLLDRASVELHSARDAIERRDFEAANRSLIHSQDIFLELQSMMRSEDALSQNVSAFLEDIAELLFFANIYKDIARIDEVLPFIERLKIIYSYFMGGGKKSST